jgi:DNA-nicking Smr family endonuclease
MLKSKRYNTHKNLTQVSQEELDLFHNTVNNSSSFKVFDKDALSCHTHHTHKKHSKFLKYRIITDSTHSASDVLFYNSGMSAKVIKQMQKGNITIDATIDLHGKTMEEACIALANFIYYHQHKQYLHIIHGKGYNAGANGMSKLKTQVDVYLKDHPQISAFCSTPQHYGGTGSVFAKLKT